MNIINETRINIYIKEHMYSDLGLLLSRKKEIHSDDKTVLLNQINVLKNSEIINEEEPSLLEDIIKKSN